LQNRLREKPIKLPARKSDAKVSNRYLIRGCDEGGSATKPIGAGKEIRSRRDEKGRESIDVRTDPLCRDCCWFDDTSVVVSERDDTAGAHKCAGDAAAVGGEAAEPSPIDETEEIPAREPKAHSPCAFVALTLAVAGPMMVSDSEQSSPLEVRMRRGLLQSALVWILLPSFLLAQQAAGNAIQAGRGRPTSRFGRSAPATGGAG
jgi:hypothetical protein